MDILVSPWSYTAIKLIQSTDCSKSNTVHVLFVVPMVLINNSTERNGTENN